MPVWSDNKPSRDETTWCQGKAPWRTTEEAVSAMITDLAQKIRLDVRPRWETYKVRFREDRDGMPKDIGGEFKEIVKLSNRDVTSACRQWAELNGRLPNHPSVLYNLGVCAEAAGSYADAQSFYRAAQAALPKRSSDMVDSADRVARLMIARADDAERARRPGNPR
jgi:tetratricopeptide (TPR) repeat protein